MARDESVTYKCDVCGKKMKAQQVRPATGQPFYVRPTGWGALSGVVQIDSDDKVKEKWDFCGRECAEKRFREMVGDAYDI